jgi:hypothetical protein
MTMVIRRKIPERVPPVRALTTPGFEAGEVS